MPLDDPKSAQRRFRPAHVTPARRPLSVPELAIAARRNLLETFPALAYHAPIVSGRAVGRWHLVMEPAALKRMLLDHVDNYPKSRATLRLLRAEEGSSIFTSEAEEWRWQRRAAAPVFAHRKLVDLAPAMSLAAARAADRLAASAARGYGGDGGVACVLEETTAATFDVVCDTLLSGGRVGEDLGLDRAKVGGAIAKYLAAIGKISLLDILDAPDWIPRPAQAANQKILEETVETVDRLIAARRKEVAETGPRADIISYLLTTADPETGREMDDATIRNNILAFIVAGHETTALTLGWALYLLANAPDVQEACAAEARAALGPERVANAAHLGRLPLTKQVIEEALRLYPPAALLGRQAREADTLCGREIRPGDTVIAPIYVLHRHEAHWERPLEFHPEHFTAERAAERSRYVYMPFGAGPRICIGMSFAINEAQIILATLLAQLRFEARPGHVVSPTVVVTLRPKGGMPLRVFRRAG